MRFRPFLNFLILLILFGAAGCVSKINEQIEYEVITPYRIVDQLSDTTFFSFVLDIAADDSVIIFLDQSNRRLIVCDHELNSTI